LPTQFVAQRTPAGGRQQRSAFRDGPTLSVGVASRPSQKQLRLEVQQTRQFLIVETGRAPRGL
jgi:hypothetical protein